MTINLNALFKPCGERPKYESTEEELEAVAAGAKAMSVFHFSHTSMDTDPTYSKLKEIAARLDLSIVITDRNKAEPDHRLRTNDVFLTKPIELWRVSAYTTLKEVFERYEWSDAAEHFESTLLGYSDEDIAKWLRVHSKSRIGWTGRTFYLLLQFAEAASVRSHAKRYLDPKIIAEPITVFFNRKHSLLREDTDCLLPEGLALARASVRHSFFRMLFGRRTAPSEPDVIAVLLTPEKAEEMNSALESNFEFLEAGAWR